VNRSVNADKAVFAPGATALTMPSPAQVSSEFSKIIKMVEPAVVNINTETIIKPRDRNPRNPHGFSQQEDPFDMFERFFGGPMENPRAPMKTKALGTGFIVDKSGYIITNYHVIDKADTINVTLGSGDDYKAKVIGKDDGTDIAILKIDAKKDLPTARLGNSDGMTQGDWVLAMGSPFGLEQTVTAGIISAVGRSGSRFQRFLQTDAAINQGNSGGPLVNMAGEVIGINTAIVTPSGGNAGVGFALPSNTALNIYNQLIKTGKVTRGAIGIQMQPSATSATLRALGATDGKGVVVSKVTSPDSPAGKAGLKQGDVIREIDGHKLSDAAELSAYVAELAPGKTTVLKYLRDGKDMTTEITVGDRSKVIPDDKDEGASEENDSEPGARVKLGIRVQNLTPQQAKEFGLQQDEGVLVANVEAGGVGDDAGLRPNDVILQVNKVTVHSPDELKNVTSKLKSGAEVLFLVKRLDRQSGEAQTLYLAASLP
ncbi:MAG: Do family serine endopeptidase, partial [Terriglobia bacterium]